MNDTTDHNRQALAMDPPEQHLLDVLDELHQNQSEGMMNVPPEDGRMLRILTEAVNAQRVVETGTSNGYSGIWFCLALRKTGGRLTTFDSDRGRYDLAVENYRRAGVSEMVTQVLGDAHEEVLKLEGQIDVLFLDADKDGYIDYLQKLLLKMRPGGLILSHNTTNSGDAMQPFLEAVTTDPALETLFIHQQVRGIGVTLVKR